MNKQYQHDIKAYPETGREVLTTAGAFKIERISLHKQTARQGYTVKWYLVTQDGRYKGAWKWRAEAFEQLDRLQKPQRPGVKMDADHSIKLRQAQNLTAKRPDLTRLISFYRTETPDAVNKFIDTVEAYRRRGAGLDTVTEILADNVPGVIPFL